MTSSIISLVIIGFVSLATAQYDPAAIPVGCNENNCLRAMIREGNIGATPFCQFFTTAVVTDPAALPTYASLCVPDGIAGISSACSCYVPKTTAPVATSIPELSSSSSMLSMPATTSLSPSLTSIDPSVMTSSTSLDSSSISSSVLPSASFSSSSSEPSISLSCISPTTTTTTTTTISTTTTTITLGPAATSMAGTETAFVTVTVTVTADPVILPAGCNGDNCLRAMIREGGVGATAFCQTFTTAVVQDMALLPTYASLCTPDAIFGISSACSCFVPNTATVPVFTTTESTTSISDTITSTTLPSATTFATSIPDNNSGTILSSSSSTLSTTSSIIDNSETIISTTLLSATTLTTNITGSDSSTILFPSSSTLSTTSSSSDSSEITTSTTLLSATTLTTSTTGSDSSTISLSSSSAPLPTSSSSSSDSTTTPLASISISSPITDVPAPTDSSTNDANLVVKIAGGCQEDDCLRAMIGEGSWEAISFCNVYTTATLTDEDALPTYASLCGPDKIARLSSACSCNVAVATPAAALPSVAPQADMPAPRPMPASQNAGFRGGNRNSGPGSWWGWR